MIEPIALSSEESKQSCVVPRMYEQSSGSLLVPAQYRKDEASPLYASNACVTCLPAALEHGEAFSAMARVPRKRPENFASLPIGIRAEYLKQLEEVYVPTRDLAMLQTQLMSVLRGSYLHRDPNTAEFQRKLWRLFGSGDPVGIARPFESASPSGGVVLYGPTGIGKTTAEDRFISYVGYYGRVHTSLGGKACWWPQAAIVRVNASGCPSVKQLASGIAAQLDRLVGSNLAVKVGRSSNHTLTVSRILSSNLVGMLFVDDMQIWSRVNYKLRIEMLDFLVGVLEETGIPIICSGTFLLKRVLEENLSQTEKLMSQGEIILGPVLNDFDVRSICAAMWQQNISSNEVAMPEWFPVEVKNHTAGVRRWIREFCAFLFLKMAIDNVTIPTQIYVRTIAHTALRPQQEPVAILNHAFIGKRVNDDLLQKYEEYISKDVYRKLVAERDRYFRQMKAAV